MTSEKTGDVKDRGQEIDQTDVPEGAHPEEVLVGEDEEVLVEVAMGMVLNIIQLQVLELECPLDISWPYA